MRPFAFALVALAFAAPAFAAEAPSPHAPAPEKLLAPTTQFYVRWDGIAAHRDTYTKSYWGGIMAGPTGDGIRTLLARVPKLLAGDRKADLDEKPITELKADIADSKALDKVLDLIGDKGAIVTVEVREPAPSVKGVIRVVGGLIDGKLPDKDTLSPDVQVIVIVPDVGDKAEVLFGAMRALGKSKTLSFLFRSEALEPFAAGGRTGFRVAREGAARSPNKSYLPLDKGKGSDIARPDASSGGLHTAWWTEGKHFVFYSGTREPKDIVAEMTANAAKGGLTNNPLYQRCQKTGSFESVARGFVDTARVIGLIKKLGGPFVPGLNERLDSTGISGLKAIVFSSGFDGKESRALYEFDAPGERKGILKALKSEPIALKDLPPMPPDVNRFSALRLDFAATYDAGLGLVEFLTMSDAANAENAEKESHAARIKSRKAELARDVDQVLGINVADDLLPHLGDKFVMFQSPGEGFSAIGTVFCISVKDAAKVKAAFARVQLGIQGLARGPVKVRKHVLKGVEYREFYARGFGIVTPTYAVVDDWLVIALHPQAVQGFILRSKGDLEKWKQDAATAKRLDKLPAGCGLQYCDPRPTVTLLCTLGAPLFSTLNLFDRDSGDEDFDPIETSVVPNSYELNKHLFPNLTVTRDDGKTIRIEMNESFSLPFEAIGIEAFGFLAYFGLAFAF